MGIKSLHKVRRTMSQVKVRISTQIDNIRKYQTKVTLLKNTVTKVKNSIQGFNSKLEEAEKIITNLKDRTVELIQTDEQKEKE